MRLFLTLLSRDLSPAARDRLAHIRVRQDFSVEQDGDAAADVLRRQIGELLRALVGKLQVDHILILLVAGVLRVLQVRARHDGISILVLEFEHRRLADRLNGRIGILDARQFDDDAALALSLDQRLGQAKLVDALLHDFDDALHRIVVDLCFRRIDRFEHDMRAALQVKALAYGICQRRDEGEKNADDHRDDRDELQ